MRSRIRLLLLLLAVSLGWAPAAFAHTRITTDLNYGKDVRPILRRHCMGCHNPRGPAPDYVDLTTYGSDRAPGARAWATAIEEEIMTGRMPPWQADRRFDHFGNTRRMTQEEIDIVIAWVGGGAPQGPRRNLAAPQGFGGEGWVLGDPDVVVEAPEAFVLPGGKLHDSTTFTVTPELEADQWITGFEFQPQNAGTVYRMAAWIHDPDGAEPESVEVEIQVPYDPFRDEDEPEPTRLRELRTGPHYLGQWLRGDAPVLFPPEMGRRLRQGSSIEVRVDYRRREMDGTDAEVSDRSQLGLFLAQEVDEVELILQSDTVGTGELELKGKKAKNPVEMSFSLTEDAKLVGLDPNLGDRLSNLQVKAVYPDGQEDTLLLLDDYTTEWPASYQFAEPIEAPAGTRIAMVGSFDLGGEKRAVEPFALDLVYAVDEHLVLPEVVEVREAPSSSGGMLAGGGIAAGTPDAGAPLDARAAAHMDHSPLHGGQFFMASNEYHHVEGALPLPGRFELYVYDDFKKPVDPRNFAGRVVFEEWDDVNKTWIETEYPMDYSEVGSEAMIARLPEQTPSAAAPLEFFAAVWLAGEEQRYDFYFDNLSKPPSAADLAKYAALRDHSHERPPTVIPDSEEAIVAEMKLRRDVLAELIEQKEWLALHVPALEARDLAEALTELGDSLSARDAGSMRQSAGRVMQAAYDLDRAGDLADAGRATIVFDRFNDAVETISGLYGG